MRLWAALVLCAFLLPCSVPVEGALIAYYPFTAAASDASGNGHDGTVNGATSTHDRYGVPASAYAFDGTDDSITVSDDGSLSGLSQFTLSCWFQAEYWPQWQTDNGAAALVSKNNAGDGSDASDSYVMYIAREENDYYMGASVWTDTSYANVYVSIESVIAGFEPEAWHEAVMSYDGSALRLSLDGQELGSSACSGSLNSNPGVPLQIGHVSGSSAHNLYFDGVIDEVRLSGEAQPVPDGGTTALLLPLGLLGLALLRKRA